jgi:geranylgeranyl pyrophosphate synthase
MGLSSIFTDFSPVLLKRVNSLKFNVDPVYGHKEIDKLLEATVLMGGKRLRPLLTFLMADFFQVQTDKVSVLAKTIEMVHAASLAHDDVIDQATMRRGQDSINIASSNKKAILAGDYLLAHVIVELSKLENTDLIKEMSLVIQSLAKGEWLQVKASEQREYSQQVINDIALCKTASVMSWCCLAPAIYAGKGQGFVETSREFGVSLGLAFQLIDDVIDFEKSSEKEQFIDLKNNLVNSVTYEWLSTHPRELEKFKNGENLIDLVDLSTMSISKETVRSRALSYLGKCRDLLDEMEEHIDCPSKKSKNSLLAVLNFLGSRTN